MDNDFAEFKVLDCASAQTVFLGRWTTTSDLQIRSNVQNRIGKLNGRKVEKERKVENRNMPARPFDRHNISGGDNKGPR